MDMRYVAVALAGAIGLASDAWAQQLFVRATTEVSVGSGTDDQGNVLPDSIEFHDTHTFTSDSLPWLLGSTGYSGGTVTDGGGQTTGAAAVGYGYIQAFSHFDGFLGASGWYMEASSRARFTDTVVINPQDPSLIGTQGTFTALFDIVHAHALVTNPEANPLGNLTKSASAESSLTINLAGTVANFQMETRVININGHTETQGDIPESLAIPVTFVFGTPFVVEVDLSTYAGMWWTGLGGGGGIQGFGFATFPNSLRWMGMDDLPEGASVEGSIDWTGPAPIIPEPANLALLGLGGLLLTGRHRQR
ncbi:MAG: PEP-CTERM sorting domain-containing protein [Phycisphaeraceae bacterium]|nr:PEP-CTERM sorting domain-containing protein [Phycisphaeraceae bacterium]